MRLVPLLLLNIGLAWTTTCHASGDNIRPSDIPLSRTQDETTGMGSSSGTTVVLIAIILSGTVILYPVMRKFRHRGPGGDGPFELVHRSQLDARTTLYAVRCGSRVLILGGTAQQIGTLSEITDPDEIELVTGRNKTPEADPAEYTTRSRQRLDSLRERLNAKLVT